MTRKIFAAHQWDECQAEWRLERVFVHRQEAIEYAYHATQTAVRCNRPMEWWRVCEHEIPVDLPDIIWGCERVTVGDSE